MARKVPKAKARDRIEAARKWPVAPLLGYDLVCAKRRAMARHIVARVGAHKKSTINFINAHCTNVGGCDAEYRHALKDSDLLLPDGVGLEIAGQMCGATLGDNLNGTDLFPEICREANEEGVGVFFLGGQTEIAQDAADWAMAHYPALRIAGTRSGFFEADEEDALIAEINASHAGILLVGLGVPLQEKWIARNRHKIAIPVVMGVGGLFDYYSGRIPRTPRLVRTCKCEWVWRLGMEPRRMAKRYILGNALFLVHAAYEAACQKGIVT
ncbi:MAG: WecB/TagA/CpsF family glycosyltransferase, partial [Erythrobacter sp.]|nr:WecB/TagA/CpsF family glycosyltransferase [Erythrobacter sp.]